MARTYKALQSGLNPLKSNIITKTIKTNVITLTMKTTVIDVSHFDGITDDMFLFQDSTPYKFQDNDQFYFQN